jgi:hypothetical protein
VVRFLEEETATSSDVVLSLHYYFGEGKNFYLYTGSAFSNTIATTSGLQALSKLIQTVHTKGTALLVDPLYTYKSTYKYYTWLTQLSALVD